MNALAQYLSHRRPTVKVPYCHDDLICGPRIHVSLELMTETGEETRLSKFKNHCSARGQQVQKYWFEASINTRRTLSLKRESKCNPKNESPKGLLKVELSKNQTHRMLLKGGLDVFFSTRGITEIDAVKRQSRVDCHQESVATTEPPGRGQRAEP